MTNVHPSDGFAAVAPRFRDKLDAVRHCIAPQYVRADWAARNAELERDLLPIPPRDFLRHPAIRYQMFVDERVLPHELPYVLSNVTDQSLLAEDPVGTPPTVSVGDGGIRTSSNTVHQLYHLLRYEQATGRGVRDAATIVEWGGGFGSLMRLLVRMHGDAPTCVLVDTPIFSAVQWLYLSAVLGEDRVILHDVGPVRPHQGLINIVPIGLVGDTRVAADLFVSNWALNESTAAAQHEVLEQRWFGARSLLLAMHAGDPLTDVVLARGARAVPVGSWMPGQQYLVA
jgi:hypothetical protein